MYSKNVIDHYENPRNVGSLPKDDSNVQHSKFRMLDWRRPRPDPEETETWLIRTK